VFDLLNSTAAPVVIPTNGFRRADELCHDPRNHAIVVANDAEADVGNAPFISFIPTEGPNAFTVVKQIKMDGADGNNSFGPDHGPLATNGIEQCQWSSRTGKIYLAIPEVNGPGDDSAAGAVLVIDAAKMVIEHMFNLDHNACAGPQGMALGPDGNILLGCNAMSGNGLHSTVVIDEHNGHIVATIAGESGGDEVWFNPGDGHYLLARSTAGAIAGDVAGSPTQLGVIDSATNSPDPSYTTGTTGFKAHSVAADPVFHQVYVPIPKNNTAAGLTSTVCSTAGGIAGVSDDATGCIAVFNTPHDDHCIAQGAPVIEASEGGDPQYLKTRCH
jgi:hypothetical protein